MAAVQSVYENKNFVETLNKLTIIEGCASAIDKDTHNTPDARHKARLIMREIVETRELLRSLVGTVVGERRAS